MCVSICVSKYRYVHHDNQMHYQIKTIEEQWWSNEILFSWNKNKLKINKNQNLKKFDQIIGYDFDLRIYLIICVFATHCSLPFGKSFLKSI